MQSHRTRGIIDPRGRLLQPGRMVPYESLIITFTGEFAGVEDKMNSKDAKRVIVDYLRHETEPEHVTCIFARASSW